MPNRRSRVNRLPKAERRQPTAKVQVLSPNQVNAGNFSRQSSASTHDIAFSSSRVPRDNLPNLPDDVWRDILSHVDLRTVLAARTVSTQFARAATEALSCTRTVHLSRLYRPTPKTRYTPPTESHVLHTLHLFPSLKTLRLSDWPYEDTIPDIVSVVSHGYSSSSLRSVDLSGVPICPQDLTALLRACPGILDLNMTATSGMDSRAAGELSAFCSLFAVSHERPRLRNLNISSCRSLPDGAVSAILCGDVATRVSLTETHGLGSISGVLRGTGITGDVDRRISATKNINLQTCTLTFVDGAENVSTEIDLSGNRSMYSVSILSTTSAPIRRLNLCGATALRSLTIPTVSTDVPVLPLVEDIALFGARALTPESLTAFGICQPRAVCAMPKLRRLDLTGTGIERLVLRGFGELESVDCSGCDLLRLLKVEDCWKLKKVRARGRRMDVTEVMIVLAVDATVEGRDVWRRERHSMHQVVAYP